MRTLKGAVTRRGVAVMGICNVTPDSFSDGGRYLRIEDALAHIDALLREGADLVDVGGESTRPGAAPVPPGAQIERVLPVVRAAAERGACVSIDTTSPAVAAACLEAGAAVVNDVSCLQDPELARVAANAGAALILMHSRPSHFQASAPGDTPARPAGAPAYGDVVADVVREWKAAVARAEAAGFPVQEPGALVMDPGLGFAKVAAQSAELLRRTREIVDAVGSGIPVMVGASRKSFLKLVDETATADERVGASIAAALVAVRGGAQIVRVHDVRATRQAIDLDRALGDARPRGGRPADA